MSRAYVVRARRDLDGTRMQVVDLQPNSTYATVTDGVGQTGYIPRAAQNDTVAHAADGGRFLSAAKYYGLAAYLNARFANGNNALTAVVANGVAIAILARVRQGLSLTESDILTLFTAAGAGNVTFAGGASRSIGTLAEILRILAGETFRVEKGEILISNGGLFAQDVVRGAFALPTVVNGVNVYPTDHYNVRVFVDTGSLRLSRASGNFSVFAATTFSYQNHNLTYMARGTALYVDNTNLLSPVARALVIYDASGNVITA